MTTTRGQLEWLPEPGTFWHVEASLHFDAVLISRHLGLKVIEHLGDRCGAIICDAWSRMLFFLTPPDSTMGWDERETNACGPSTFVAVPPLGAPEHLLHWAREPDEERLFTEAEALRRAIRQTIAVTLGPRTEHFG
ncbi:hypothetical protein G6045_32215 [Streptomyces sp. YC504]|uniref:Uncharacterized protein n=1 Tax=Streptomyces mesophilus TaxID=1775132 RepID=A0A6G4XUK8_9ACTN|nr:hypothetical protein [Streptomyces mesophilus]NGO80291.1 hypothetical protein [Streptomyces mesophilus]